MSMPWFLELLDLPAHADARAVRRAYAVRVKQIDPGTEPAAFARLREAYEAARAWVDDEEHDVVAITARPVPRVTAEPVPLTPLREHVVPIVEQTPLVVDESLPAAPPHAPVIELENVADDETAALPVAPPVNPQEQATRLMERFAARIAAGNARDIRRELEACAVELRLQYIDAPGIFEEVLIDHLANGLLGNRAAVFALASGHFHWQEIGHVTALGPRGAWIDAVESQRMAWNGVAPLARTNMLSLIERAAAVNGILPSHIVSRWIEVRDAFHRFPAYLGLYLTPALQHEWALRYEALPDSERLTPERPEKKRRPGFRMIDVPHRVWAFVILAALAMIIGLFDHPPETSPQPGPVTGAAGGFITSLRVTIGETFAAGKRGRGWIDVTLTNNGRSTLYLSRDLTPPMTQAGHLARPLFSVRDPEGHSARFTRDVVSVTSKDPSTYYVRLNPGQTLSNTFDLGADYALLPGNRYNIVYRQPVTSTFSVAADGSIRDQTEYVMSNAAEMVYSGKDDKQDPSDH